MSDALRELLEGYKYDALLAIAEFNRVPALRCGPAKRRGGGKKPVKAAIVDALCGHLLEPQRATRVMSSLSSLERTVLDRVLLHPGDLPTSVLREELQREDIVEPGPHKGKSGSYEGTLKSDRDYLEDVLARLTLRGLVFSREHPVHALPGTKLGLSPGLVLTVPEPLRSNLPKPPLPPVDWGRGNLPAPIEVGSTLIAQRDLFLYWSCVRSEPAPLTRAGLLPKRSLRSINEQLISPDPALAAAPTETSAPRLYFMRLLLQALGLLETEHALLRPTGPRSRMPDIWKFDSVERTRLCIQTWQGMKQWSELASLSVTTLSFDLPQARSVLLEHLRLLPAGAWMSAERFLNRMAIVAPRLLFEARHVLTPDSARGASSYQGTGLSARQSRWFAEAEAAFVGGALSGPLHWLGLLDVSADEGRLLAFRINADGARVLETENPAPEEPLEARLVVQPNFQILALGAVPEQTLASLEVFADRVKVDRSAIEYSLCREAVYRAQKDGLSIPTIVEFLQRQGSAPVPQNVIRTLQEWGHQHERIIFHRSIALCQVADTLALDRLWADPVLQRYLERSLSPTVALIKRGRTTAFKETLLEKGILPICSTSDNPCAARAQVTRDGELCPAHPGPDLFLEACLRELAEERSGKFYVTESAVIKALEAGVQVSDYLSKLQAIVRGPLPDGLQTRIKAWGHYYGKASLRPTTLLEVRDAAAANELLADAELGPLLTRLNGQEHGKVLIVSTRDLQGLRRLLRERGIEIA